MPGKKIVKEIDLSHLPRKKKGRIDWINSVGEKLHFKYDDIEGDVLIAEYSSQKVRLVYQDNEMWTKSNEVANVKFGSLLRKRVSYHRFQVGEIVTNVKGLTGKIIRQYRKGKNNSVKFYDIECSKCGHVFDLPEPEIFHGRGWCPICDNQNHIEVVVGRNDMWTTNPEVASQLLNPDDGYKYSFKTTKHLNWKCSKCGAAYPTTFMPRRIYDNYHGRILCKACNDGYSYPNKFIYHVLTVLNVEFIPEKVFDWSNGRIYDFYIPKHPMIIEAMGDQHYRNCSFRTSLEERKNIDQIKRDMAITNGIPDCYYLSINCSKSSPEFIMQNLKNSILNDIYNLDIINLDDINKKCMTTIEEQIGKLVNEGKNINEIIEILQCSYVTIKKYIELAERDGLCKYDREKFYNESLEKQAFNQRQRSGKPFMCLENGTVYMTKKIFEKYSEQVFGKRFWGSILSQSLKFDTPYNGYHWKYITKEEFNKIKYETPDKAFGDFFILEKEVA